MSQPTTASSRVRLTPERRREQLLDLGVRLFAHRPVEEISIEVLAEEAGVSRGLMYHYFGNKRDFREAVCRRAAADLVEQTAPPVEGDPLERLLASVTAYLDYVIGNYEVYLSLVRSAQSGNQTLRAVYDEARSALTDRIFTEDAQGSVIPDTPAARLLVRGWAAMAEELVLAWMAEPGDVTRAQLLDLVAGSLPALVTTLPNGEGPAGQDRS